MKTILISIQPKWCKLIASGIKTVEVRKTRPKTDTPFKCYIYCTLSGSNEFFKEDCSGDIAKWNKSKIALKKGKVIGEFVCDQIFKINVDCDETFGNGYDSGWMWTGDDACLSYFELDNYLQGEKGYGWHISNLVIYDKPKELSEFRKYISFLDGERIEELEESGMSKVRITRAPQSWCYVEGGAE